MFWSATEKAWQAGKTPEGLDIADQELAELGRKAAGRA
jgi:hypothetical protein